MTIGKRIKDLRVQKNISQRALSRMAGVSQPTVSDYENEVIKEHRAHILVKLAKPLGTTSDYLLTGKSDKDFNNAENLKLELVNAFDQLAPHLQVAMLNFAKALIQSK